MPSFAAIAQEDLDALVDYVIYLSIRGEVERELMAAAVDELDYGSDDDGPDAIAEEWRLAATLGSEGGEVAREVLADVVSQWDAAGNEVVAVPEFETLVGDPLKQSVQRGRELFNGQIAACAGCHGKDGGGQALLLDYDDWTKEYSTRIGIDPNDRDKMRPLKKLGALTPRIAKPRDLRMGNYRGGNEPADLYRRITQGIAGSPMPAVIVTESQSGVGLTDNQIWDLVRYLQSFRRNR